MTDAADPAATAAREHDANAPNVQHRGGQNSVLTLPPNLVYTPFLEAGYLTAQQVVEGNNVVAFDGLPGTGKTTCARLVAANAVRNCAVVRMSHDPAPLDLLRHMIWKITGDVPVGTRWEMQQTLLGILPDWNGCLVVDELQHSKPAALQELVWLYEETEHAFGLVVIGSDVLKAIDAYPQLKRRILASVTFAPLTGAELVAAVRDLDPRLRKMTRGQILSHDEAACYGLISRWVQTIEWLDIFGIDRWPTNDDLQDVRSKLPILAIGADDIDDFTPRPGRKRNR